jgi:Predicted dinucleotide-binding enzymes
MCGDDPAALRVVGELVRDAGGEPAVLGPLSRPGSWRRPRDPSSGWRSPGSIRAPRFSSVR